jgi:hypothetical protein
MSKAREKFEQKKQYNEIVRQLNAKAAETTQSPKAQTKTSNAPDAQAPAAPPQWWQYQQQYGAPTTAVNKSPFGKIFTNAGGIQAQYPEPFLPSQATSAAQQYNQVAQNPELKYNLRGYQAPGNYAPPPAWWNQTAQGYAQQASAYQASGGTQPPESPLDDFYFRHPDQTTLTPPATTSGGGSGGGKRRGGGGRGGGYGYSPRESYGKSYNDNLPAWARGLANWSIG